MLAAAGEAGAAIGAVGARRARRELRALAAVVAVAVAGEAARIEAQATARRAGWGWRRRWGLGRLYREDGAVGTRATIVAVGARGAE